MLENARPVLEVHLFHFNEAIYGQRLQVEFLHKLRNEEKFTDVETLVKQIERDVAHAQAYFSQMDSSTHALACLDC